MSRLEIRPFSDEFLAPAGDLLAARHRAHRTAEPLLPPRFEEPGAAAAKVEELARERGYGTMVTDWRVTNLLASRFWSARGFRPTFLRLYRHIP